MYIGIVLSTHLSSLSRNTSDHMTIFYELDHQNIFKKNRKVTIKLKLLLNFRFNNGKRIYAIINEINLNKQTSLRCLL